MRNHPLPWESVPDPKYLARDTTQRKGWVKAGGWVLVVALLAAGIATRWRVALVFGVLYALALVMEKSVAVTQRGLEIFHDMRVTTNYEHWPWQDVEALTHEPDPKMPAQTIVYFTRGDRTKRFSFAKSDAEGILRLAREKNSGIKIYDGREMRGRINSKLKRK